MASAIPRVRADAAAIIVAALLLAWMALYGAALSLDHLTLRTNAFDLSVFDYALWSTTDGVRAGDVPFYKHSLSSHHFMPTLWVLWPLHALTSGPELLIGVQFVAIAGAAALLGFGFARDLPRLPLLALMAAFLFSRRSHVAASSVFYVESLEPLLLLGLVWAAQRGQPRLYWVCLLLALGCKEDVAIYTAGCGVLFAARPETRALGVWTIAASVLWLAAALIILIPWAQAIDNLPREQSLLASRYGESPIIESVARLWRWESLRRFVSLSLITGLICWVRPRWLLVAVPGIVLNLAAKAGTLQAGLIGHYLWPILPFVFLAAVDGIAAAYARWPKLTNAWALAVILAVLANNPVFRPTYFTSRISNLDEAGEVRAMLARIPASAAVAAQPQLIPHLPRRTAMDAINAFWPGPGSATEVVVLAGIGDQWPLTRDALALHVATLSNQPAFRRVHAASPHLFLFVRRGSHADAAFQ